MEIKDELKKALAELRKEKVRKFDQTVELIVNLKKFNTKKESLNTIIYVPHKIKEKKIAAFLDIKNQKVFTITESEFDKFKDKKEMKSLTKKYDFFISQARLMPKVATVFGKILGPTGKMPSPQLGIVMNADDKIIEELKDKINKSVKIRTKEASIKVSIGKQSMKDEDLAENIFTIYNSLIKELPRGKENIKDVKIKFTMTKPYKISSKWTLTNQ